MNPLIALFVTATTFLAYAGDPKIPTDHRPLSILLNDTILQNFGDEVYRDDRDHPIFLRQYVKYRFAPKPIEILSDSQIPARVNAITENDRYIFVGGKDGLGVYDKQTKVWSKWYSETIHSIVADQKTLWMGTLAGVKQINLSDRKSWVYQSKQGLNSDKVYSLCKMDNSLFVGTYRFGTRIRGERGDNMYGTGLNRIDLSTKVISKIPIPYSMFDIVIDMYPVGKGSENLRLVIGNWEVAVYDFNLKTSKLVKLAGTHHHLESVLAKNKKQGDSLARANLVEYLIQEGIDEWSATSYSPIISEVIEILYKGGEFNRIESLLSSKDSRKREFAYAALRKIIDPRTNAYLLKGLDDEDESVFSTASNFLVSRKVKEAIPLLRKAFSQKESRKPFLALDALLYLDPKIAREIIIKNQADEIEVLESVVRIANFEFLIKAIKDDKFLDAQVRKTASEVLERSTVGKPK